MQDPRGAERLDIGHHLGDAAGWRAGGYVVDGHAEEFGDAGRNLLQPGEVNIAQFRLGKGVEIDRHDGDALTPAGQHAVDAEQAGGQGIAVELEWQIGRILEKRIVDRSEEHTSELQSLMRNSYAVFCLNKK